MSGHRIESFRNIISGIADDTRPLSLVKDTTQEAVFKRKERIMSDGSSQQPVARGERPAADAQAIRDACISAQTRKKYTNNISGIKKWIREFLPQDESESNTARFFNEKGDLNLTEFTPAYFEKFLVHKRRTAKSVTLSGYRSAIKDLYRLEGIKLPVEYGDSMTQFFSGIKRLEAEQNQSSTPKTSGKQPLTYSLYKTLCDASLVRNDSGFSHLFLTTQWNLMCRSVSVQTLQTQHLQVQDDSVGAIFFKTKTDQEGAGPRDPRHLYANPFSPSTCWITALGVYLACNPRLRPGALFPGSDQKVRFGKVLTSLLRGHGVGKSFGTHSIRKGVATFACGGSTGGPSIVSVCLRCGWSIGGVQDRYFRYEAAGDQFLGRVVAGLPVNDAKFAALPPHFDGHADETVKTTVKKMFPGLADESNLSEILELCLASLASHANFLLKNLPSNHDLLSTFVFTNPAALTELRGKLKNDGSTQMHATGIPPHIELYRKLDMQQKSIDALPELLEERMEQVLEKKGVAAGNITRELLREEIRSLLADAGLHQNNENEQVDIRQPPAREYYTWGGKFHLLPEGFEFPSIDPLAAWMLWWFGDTRRGYPPYKGISSEDLNTPKKKATLSEWSMMMRHIINAIESELAAPMPSVRDEAHAIDLFKKGYGALKLKPSTRKRRSDQIKLTTALRLVREVNTTGSMPFKPRKRRKQQPQSNEYLSSERALKRALKKRAFLLQVEREQIKRVDHRAGQAQLYTPTARRGGSLRWAWHRVHHADVIREVDAAQRLHDTPSCAWARDRDFEVPQDLCELVRLSKRHQPAAVEQQRNTDDFSVYLLAHGTFLPGALAIPTPPGLHFQVGGHNNKQGLHKHSVMSRFSIVETVTSSITKVVAPMWSGKMERNSRACLEFVKQQATKNDPASVISAIDTFATSNIMMNVGAGKGAIVDAEIGQKKPRVMAEIGAYTGYSTVRFASAQRDATVAAGLDSHYYSFEYSPEFAARAREMVSFAGLDDQVTIIEGAFSDNLHLLDGKTVDLYFIDHDKSLYVSDAKKIIASGTLQPGSLLIADNVLIPGAPEYLDFIDEHPQLEPVLHKVPLDVFSWVNDALSVATFSK